MELKNDGIQYWYLDEQNVPQHVEGDVLKWASNPRSHVHIDKTIEGKVYISTIFIGLGEAFTGLPYFETMIFGGPLDMYQERCGTYAQALDQHKEAVELHKASLLQRRIKE
jgi:hypothetical protein